MLFSCKFSTPCFSFLVFPIRFARKLPDLAALGLNCAVNLIKPNLEPYADVRGRQLDLNMLQTNQEQNDQKVSGCTRTLWFRASHEGFQAAERIPHESCDTSSHGQLCHG